MFSIKFNISNSYDKNLKKIFNNINFDNYIWKIEEEEVFGNKSDCFFEKTMYNSKEFQEKIDSDVYYIIFLNLQLFKNGTKIVKINTYKDFVSSDCELILFVTDSKFVQIYSKQSAIINKIKENLELNNINIIQNEIKEIDVRKVFSAYRD